MMRYRYTDEQIEFIKDNVKNPVKDLTKMFNERFGMNVTTSSIEHLKHKYNLRSGIRYNCFKKGNIPHNKGKKWDEYISKEVQDKIRTAQFKKGYIPHNHRPVGSERISKDGYIYKKTGEPNAWKEKHRYIYEQHFGEIPKNYIVSFADGNNRNLDINNLILISKNENKVLNANGLRYKDTELTKSGLLVAKLIIKQKEMENDN